MIREFVLRNILINLISASVMVPKRLRWVLLRCYGVQIERAAVRPGCFFGGPRVQIGSGAFVNTGAFFDGSDQITVGRRVHIGMQVMLVTGGHQIGDQTCRAGAAEAGPIAIGDGAWIGARAVIMPGVTVGAGAVVAAGAVVVGDVPANTVVGGVPAAVIRTLAGAAPPSPA